MASDRPEKIANIWCLLNFLGLSRWLSMKFMWGITINKMQVDLQTGSYALILTGVMAPDRPEKLQIFGFYPIT